MHDASARSVQDLSERFPNSVQDSLSSRVAMPMLVYVVDSMLHPKNGGRQTYTRRWDHIPRDSIVVQPRRLISVRQSTNFAFVGGGT